MKTGKERIEYLDLLKAIAIILVVFCHRVTLSADTVLGNVIMIIAWAAVPNFFFVTGGLMHQAKTWDWKKYWKKILRAYVVVCIWKLIYLVFYCSFRDITFSTTELVRYLFVFGNISGVVTGHLWFMYAYLMVHLFYPVSWFLFRDKQEGQRILGIVAVILFVGTFLVKAGNFAFELISDTMGIGRLEVSVTEVFPFGTYANMLFFFIVGAFLFEYREKIKDVMKKRHLNTWLPVTLLLVGTAGLLFVKYRATGTFTWHDTYLEDGYNRLMTVVLSLGMYLLILNLPVHKAGKFLAKWVGTNTMGIYYLHVPLLVYCQINLSSYYKEYYSLGCNVLKTLIALLICTGITLVIKRIPVLKTLVK